MYEENYNDKIMKIRIMKNFGFGFGFGFGQNGQLRLRFGFGQIPTVGRSLIGYNIQLKLHSLWSRNLDIH